MRPITEHLIYYLNLKCVFVFTINDTMWRLNVVPNTIANLYSKRWYCEYMFTFAAQYFSLITVFQMGICLTCVSILCYSQLYLVSCTAINVSTIIITSVKSLCINFIALRWIFLGVCHRERKIYDEFLWYDKFTRIARRYNKIFSFDVHRIQRGTYFHVFVRYGTSSHLGACKTRLAE